MIKTCQQLLTEFTNRYEHRAFKTAKLNFTGVADCDVYNITAPFSSAGKVVIAGRVETRTSEFSEIVFFEEVSGIWTPIEGALRFQLQDPFFSIIQDELVLGGVQVFPDPLQPQQLAWRTIFLKGKDIFSLREFASGPERMKDIRLAELPNQQILVLTRPQGELGGRGKIGHLLLNGLHELTAEAIAQATLLAQFDEQEWGGGNEIHVLNNGTVGVLAHIACFDEQQNRHYYPAAFQLDPFSGSYSDLQLIAYRGLFTPGEAKRPDLEDVVFSGGLVRRADGSARLYVGISDAEAHWIEIADPFHAWERTN